MKDQQNQGELFAPSQNPTDQIVALNSRCQLRSQGEYRIILLSGIPVAHYRIDDRNAEAYWMVNLIELGWATQKEVAQGFACATRTVRRNQRRYEAGGLTALGRPAGYPKGKSRAPESHFEAIRRLKAEGHSNREIGRQIGRDEKAIRNALLRIGWAEEEPQVDLPFMQPAAQSALPSGAELSGTAAEKMHDTTDSNVSTHSTSPQGSRTVVASVPSSATAESKAAAGRQCQDDPTSFTMDQDPQHRSIDRFLAYVGKIEDAVPLFASAQNVPCAGVLLAIPGLLQSGVIDCARQVYGTMGPAFYGLRTTMVVLVLMALIRIKRPEGLKEKSPPNLGRIIGLDRTPEVKTLRRKLRYLAGLRKAGEFGRALASKRVEQVGDALSFLYVDGHVRVYHGKHELPKTYVTKKRLALPSTTDYWVNDCRGDPLLVMTAEANDALTQILPSILKEVRTIVGERSTTIVFDRGGFSPKMFKQLVDDKFHVLTYRKGTYHNLAKKSFTNVEETIDGQKVSYCLNDREVKFLRGKFKLRQVTIRSEDGHQTRILTSRRDLRAAEVAYRMFDRWRQENYFKYLIEEFALDALADYSIEAANPERLVPNPKRAKIEADLRMLRVELKELKAQYGLEALTNPEEMRRTMRGFKIANAKMAKEIERLVARYNRMKKQRDRMPKKVPVKQVAKKEVIKLSPERKHLTNLIKMVAYQVESDLVRQVGPFYHRAEDEGRTLIQSAMMSAADIEVSDEGLQITLAPLSSPHLTKAITSLCEELNKTKPRFPGTKLTLRFGVQPPP